MQSLLRIDDVATNIGSGNMRIFSLRYKGERNNLSRLPLLSGRNSLSSELPLTEEEESLLQTLEGTEGIENVSIDEENELVVIKKESASWGSILVAIERGVDRCLQSQA